MSLQARLFLLSTVTVWTDSEVCPVGMVQPGQRPVLASSYILSRMHSAIHFHSSWLNTEAMYIIIPPISMEVSRVS